MTESRTVSRGGTPAKTDLWAVPVIRIISALELVIGLMSRDY